MRRGAYTCDDQRKNVNTLPPLVRAGLVSHSTHREVSITDGVMLALLVYDKEDPKLLDDESNGRLAIPTPDGFVNLQWVTKETYAAIIEELGDDAGDAPSPDAPDEERQQYLVGLCS